MAPRRRPPPHVHDEIHRVRAEQPQERVELPRRVADGVNGMRTGTGCERRHRSARVAAERASQDALTRRGNRTVKTVAPPRAYATTPPPCARAMWSTI